MGIPQRECLDTNFVSSVGPFVDRFEREVAARVGTRFGIATASGTAALHVALLVMRHRTGGRGAGASSLTFIAMSKPMPFATSAPGRCSWMPIRCIGKWTLAKCEVFWNRSANGATNALYNKRTGRRVRAILRRFTCWDIRWTWTPITELARKYKLKVIEDATECLGARYKGRPTGSLADIACFSFNGNKIITTGGGGMITTDNEAWAKRAKYLTTQAKDEPVEFIHGEIGYNYRLTNLQAAMGCAQLEQLDKYIAAKRRIAARYTRAFQDQPGLQSMREAPWADSVFWMYTLLVDSKDFGRDSRELLRRLEREKIQARPLWQPMHRSPAHKQTQAHHCEVAERLNREALSLPCSAGLSAEQQEKVIAVVTDSIKPPRPTPQKRETVPA